MSQDDPHRQYATTVYIPCPRCSEAPCLYSLYLGCKVVICPAGHRFTFEAFEHFHVQREQFGGQK